MNTSSAFPGVPVGLPEWRLTRPKLGCGLCSIHLFRLRAAPDGEAHQRVGAASICPSHRVQIGQARGDTGEIDGRSGTQDPPRVDCPECIRVTLPRDMTVPDAMVYAVEQVLPPQITVTRLTIGGVAVPLPEAFSPIPPPQDRPSITFTPTGSLMLSTAQLIEELIKQYGKVMHEVGHSAGRGAGARQRTAEADAARLLGEIKTQIALLARGKR